MIPFDPEEAMRSGLYTSGTTGSGKSDVAMYATERLMEEGVTIVVFDPSQDWITRSNIHSYAMPKMQEYLWNGHVPQRNFIFDLSQLTVVEKEGFVEDFCKALMQQQAKQQTRKYFLVFEEAHTFFPQGCMTARRTRNTSYLMTQGRNYGIRFGCVTQFASLLDKNAMRYMRQRYFGFTDEPNDLDYVKRFFPKEDRKEIEKELMELKVGQFIYKYGTHQQTFNIQPFHSNITPQPQQPPPPQAPVSITATPISTDYGIALARIGFLTFMGIMFFWIITKG